MTGKENSNFAVCWECYIRVSSTEPPLKGLGIINKVLKYLPILLLYRFFPSLGKAHPHWLLATTSYRVPCSICIYEIWVAGKMIFLPLHIANGIQQADRKKKKLGQPIWMQISVKPVVAF